MCGLSGKKHTGFYAKAVRCYPGFTNPAVYLFDWELAEHTGELHVRYKLPYSDAADLDEAQKQKRIADSEPMEFSHTLDTQIGGQIAAGFVIAGFYEDKDEPEALDHWENIRRRTLLRAR